MFAEVLAVLIGWFGSPMPDRVRTQLVVTGLECLGRRAAAYVSKSSL